MDEQTIKIIEKLTSSTKALKVYKSNVLLRTLSVLVAFICGMLLSFFGALSIVQSNGSFTVSVPDEDKEIALTLSETSDFLYPTGRLTFDSDFELDNISVNDLPDGLDDIDGAHNGENYLAFTFYLKNVGEIVANITASMKRTDVVKESDKAIRVRIYKNGVLKTYAMLAENGEPEFDGSIPFADDELVFSDEYPLNPGEVMKYTIVIWLEGDDPECIDLIKGGFVKLKMEFTGKK